MLPRVKSIGNYYRLLHRRVNCPSFVPRAVVRSCRFSYRSRQRYSYITFRAPIRIIVSSFVPPFLPLFTAASNPTLSASGISWQGVILPTDIRDSHLWCVKILSYRKIIFFLYTYICIDETTRYKRDIL